MSAIRPEDLLRYFEETQGIQFMDASTGKRALEVLQKTKHASSDGKSDYDQWLEAQDEATKLELKMAEI
jgi:hypothetical protein